jgi:hypothetical protein
MTLERDQQKPPRLKEEARKGIGGNIIHDFCLSMEEDSDFQEAKRGAKELSDFKEFEEELQAIKAWFLVLTRDERKYSLETLANAAKLDIPKAIKPGGWRISAIEEDPKSTQTGPPPGWI